MGENLVLGLFLSVPVVTAASLLFLRRRLRRANANIPRFQLVIGNLLVLTFLVGLFFLSGEVYFRFFSDTTDSLLYTKISQRWMQRHWHNNLNGVRDNIDYSPTRSPGRKRVSFIGDSFTAAEGVADVDDRFVNHIRKAHPEWEVHMLAEPGFDTGDELFYLRAAAQNGYEFDQVVLVYCLNDVSDLLQEHTESVQRIKNYVMCSGWLTRNSYFVNVLDQRIKARRDPFMKDYFAFVRNAYRGPMWEKQKVRLKAFRDLIQSRGGSLCVVTFPFLNALGPNYEYAFVHQELDQFWRESNVPHLDLLPIFQTFTPQKLTVNSRDAHPNEFANELAAKAINDFLTARLTTSE